MKLKPETKKTLEIGAVFGVFCLLIGTWFGFEYNQPRGETICESWTDGNNTIDISLKDWCWVVESFRPDLRCKVHEQFGNMRQVSIYSEVTQNTSTYNLTCKGYSKLYSPEQIVEEG